MPQASSGGAEAETPAAKLPQESAPSAAPADDTAMLETNDEDLRLALQMSMVSPPLAPTESRGKGCHISGSLTQSGRMSTPSALLAGCLRR